MHRGSKAAARRIIAANAEGKNHDERVADAEELMRMLGVHPDQFNKQS